MGGLPASSLRPPAPHREIVMSAWGIVVTACAMDRFQCGEVSRFAVAGRAGKRSRRAR